MSPRWAAHLHLTPARARETGVAMQVAVEPARCRARPVPFHRLNGVRARAHKQTP